MIAELVENRDVANLLRGASIILSVEPDVQLRVALERSRVAEEKSLENLRVAITLIARTRKELDLNGDIEPNREQARKILNHMLQDPPWRIEQKQLP